MALGKEASLLRRVGLTATVRVGKSPLVGAGYTSLAANQSLRGNEMYERRLQVETLPHHSEVETEVEELPLKVVPDWDDQVKRATEAARLIDRHLDYEARGRLLLDLDDFRPQHLCPEQRVQMVSDLYAVTR